MIVTNDTDLFEFKPVTTSVKPLNLNLDYLFKDHYDSSAVTAAELHGISYDRISGLWFVGP
jgi:hypothetical protein